MGKAKRINPAILKAIIRQETGLDVILENQFHPTRQWKSDLAIPSIMVCIELEGGVWTRGRHTRGQGYIDDCSKYNACAVLGWTVLRYTHSGHGIGDILKDIQEIIKYRTNELD